MDTQQQFSDAVVQSLIELGRSTAGPTAVQTIPGNPVPFIIVNGAVKALPELLFNEHAERPERIKANVNVLDTDSFIAYHNLFADADSRIFAYEPETRVTAVLDYHESVGGLGEARWCQHKLNLILRKSEEWVRWTGANNKHFSQAEFAEFLEQNAIDIIAPAPAAMMEVARDLQATTEVEFGSGTRMQDGQVRFKYTETTKATVGSGALAVPERFTISIPAFIGGQRVSIEALLRFRVKEGRLVIWYTLVRPESVVREAFTMARNLIAEALKTTIINGQA